MTWGATDVTVAFGHATVLHGVSLHVDPGEVTAVVGGDGAGKTTLLNAILGTVRTVSGEVSRPSATRMSAVVASGGVYDDLTVGENLAFVADAYGLDVTVTRERITALLQRARLEDARARLAGHLSGGMRHKLALTMALLPRPDLLVLDEPTTGVDPVSRAQLWLLLTSAAAEGTAVILSTTYLEEAERAVRLLVLDQGQTLVEGSPHEVLTAMPGALSSATARPASAHAWRDGHRWRVWTPTPGDGGHRLQPRLEDVVIVAQLQRLEAAS